MITLLVILTVVLIALLIAVLAIYLFWVGVLLNRIADNLDNSNESVKTIAGHAELIVPGVEHINRTGGIVAGALPLLYGHAERIAAKLAPSPGSSHEERGASPSADSGRRRSRLMESVGFPRRRPDQ